MKSKTAYLGMFLAMALICSYVESLIPFPFGVPGMKLGLANFVTVMLLYTKWPKDAFSVSVLRILLSGFLFGNPFSILYSLSGGCLSFFVMFFVKSTGKFRIVPVSVAGGMSHNVGQLLLACAVVENYHLFYYAPVLLTAGFVTGALIGILAQEMAARTRAVWYTADRQNL